ncbi:primary-amine oxidase [Actinoplanes sp. ATCC 53533]|uniref:copper amine oxidase n=1 Tax=Actinoplanes sp. ATCC 53533 TaxID=1288362 RepID=UPI001F3BA644|nr:primary-amine oxidase [Actinoplanes sp. ATCC 53533]
MTSRFTYLTGAAALLAALAVAAPAAQAAPSVPPAPPAPAAPCNADSLVKETLPSGTTWQMCWRIHRLHGLILEKVFVSSPRYPQPVQVLGSITVAQLNVPYDNGETEYNDITDYGFGGEYLQTLGGDDCKGGSARVGSDNAPEPARRAALCVSAEPSGLAYRLENPDQDRPPLAKQGHDLVLKAISKVGWYEYITEYRFGDNGRITARLGATGDLSPGDYTTSDKGWPIGKGARAYASNHYHSAFWRVDFNIAGAGKEKIEQYDTKRAGNGAGSAILKTTRTAVGKEGTFTKANRRWWRVVSPTSKNKDGHPRSYQLETGANDPYEAHPETTPDVTFTQQRPCERFATGNADPQCRTSKTILDYVRNSETLTDPVMWVRVGFHHVPRDEDQSPMPVHWQGFDLTPRDFTETNTLTPPERGGVNGQPSGAP